MQFQTDYIISWDFSDKDCPVVNISRLRAGEKSMHLECDVLSVEHEKCGVVSLRQLIEAFEAEKRRIAAAADDLLGGDPA